MSVVIRGNACETATPVVDRDLVAIARLAAYITDGGSLASLTQDAASVLLRLFPSLAGGLVAPDFVALNTTELFQIANDLKRVLFEDQAYVESVNMAARSIQALNNPEADAALAALQADIKQSSRKPDEVAELRAKLATLEAALGKA